MRRAGTPLGRIPGPSGPPARPPGPRLIRPPSLADSPFYAAARPPRERRDGSPPLVQQLQIPDPSATPAPLSEAQLAALIERLAAELRGGGGGGADGAKTGRGSGFSSAVGHAARAHERFDFIAAGVPIVVSHPGGSTARLSAFTLNISATGLAFLYPGFLHAGTAVRLALPRRAGGTHECAGRVAWCRHAQGRFHACGVRLDAPLDPGVFTSIPAAAENPSACAGSPASPALPRLRGAILHLDPEELDRRLLGLYLAETGARFVPAANPVEALERLRTQPIDLILCEADLGSFDAPQAVASIRSAGFAGPLLMLTAETDPRRLRACRAAGADGVLDKPYDPPALLRTLSEHLESRGLLPPEAAIYSDLERRPGGREAVAAFIRAAGERLVALRAAIRQRDADAATAACRALLATGAPAGFPLISECAADALASLSRTGCPYRSLPDLRRLENAIHRLRLRN